MKNQANDEKPPDSASISINCSAAELGRNAERMSIPDRALLILERLLDRPGTPAEYERKRQFVMLQIREAVSVEREQCALIAANHLLDDCDTECGAFIAQRIRTRKT